MDLILRTGRRPLLYLPPSGTAVGYRHIAWPICTPDLSEAGRHGVFR